MDDKATRLHFEEEDLKDKRVSSAAKRAEKAADKADKAVEKLPKKKKLKTKSQAEVSAAKKLKFEGEEAKDVAEVIKPKPSTAKHAAGAAPIRSATAAVHQKVGEDNEDDNVGVESLNKGEEFVEDAVYTMQDAEHFSKVKKYDKAEKLMEKSDKANVDALYAKKRAEEPEAKSNPISRWMQKKKIKSEYAAMKGGYAAGSAAGGAASTAEASAHAASAAGSASSAAGKAVKESKGVIDTVIDFVEAHSTAVVGLLCAGGLIAVIMGSFSSCSAFLPGTGGAVIATTYTAEDEDILNVEADYCALESALENRINNIENEYGGYDEYNYYLDEIGHNPFELASYLTVKFEDYKRADVQAELQRIFNEQYELEIEEKVETRSYTEHHHETEADGSSSSWTETVYYDYYILNVTLHNKGLGTAIFNLGMDEEESERYAVLMSTYGNKMYLFEDSIYAIESSEYGTYQIPGEALTDEKFANMIREAEKYLGYPYVWGGSSPSTSFDCSGFVSWVINNCGNGWSVGRLTANGLKNICTVVSASEAKPGDLIFFQGTYNTSGASHVGIYVGDGMMIHCGNPIQYASVQTSYWQSHFYCYGRLP